MITIGDTKLATRRPADLDGALIAATGCNATEHVAMLTNRPTPIGLANALRPYLTGDDAPSAAELAAMINGDDLIRVRGDVVALLKAAPTVEDPPAPTAENPVSDA